MKPIIIAFIFLGLCFLPSRVNSADFPIQEANFNFSTPTIQGKYNWTGVYYSVTNLPSNINYHGIQGTFSLSADATFANSTAIVLVQLGYYPSGKCPSTGYEDSGTDYSQYGTFQTLQRFVLQLNNPGTVTLPVNFMFPKKISLPSGS